MEKESINNFWKRVVAVAFFLSTMTSLYSQSVSIVGSDVDENGVASAYVPHSFSVQADGMSLSDHQWECLLPVVGGEYETVQTSTSDILELPALENVGNYENVEGCISAVVNYKGMANGEQVSSTYNLKLNLKPMIVDVEALEYVAVAPGGYVYDATIGITYHGSDYLHMYVEEEYSSLAMVYTSRVPNYAIVELKDINSYGDAWVHLTARNDYGSDEMVFDISYNNLTSVEVVESAPEVESIDVYNAAGQFVKRILSIGAMAEFDKGLYILRQHNSDGSNAVVKYYNK